MYTTIAHLPIGYLGIKTTDKVLISLQFLGDNIQPLTPPPTAFAASVVQQLEDYFLNANTIFNVPFQLQGTPFQRKVWETLQTIPVGKTLSYGKLAKQLQTSARAIGNACRTNPIPIIIPCHRIVGQNGLGGFGGVAEGSLIAVKKQLLQHEGVLL
jgi:methylated-DNA-[protein]-cysteine S-methyltransferase